MFDKVTSRCLLYARGGRDFEKSQNVKPSSEPEKRNGLIFRYYVYFPPAMTPGPSVGILTLLIISRGPNYQIKSVMTGLTINNYSILKTSGGELELFLQCYKQKVKTTKGQTHYCQRNFYVYHKLWG